MIQTNHWKREDKLNKDRLIQLLQEKFKAVDFDKASQDVRPFIKDKQELALFFKFFTNNQKDYF